MINQNLIIYNFKSLYLILEELEEYLNFKILDVPNINDLKDKIKKKIANIKKKVNEKKAKKITKKKASESPASVNN